MKKILLLILYSSFLIFNSHAQVPNWLWANGAGGTGNDQSFSISADAGGNVYVTGYFYSSSITFGSTVLTNAGLNDIFLAKYDGAGNVLWARSAGGPGYESGNAVSTDVNGSVFATGYFESPSIIFGSDTLSNTGLRDIFIVKYDSSGNVMWTRSASGTSTEAGICIAADAGGNVFVSGYFWSQQIIFGSVTLTNSNTTYTDIFTAKYDGTGNVLWAKRGATSESDNPTGICTDANGNAYLTGRFSSSISFGTITLMRSGIFIVKYDGAGNVNWARDAAGTSAGNGICTDAGGNLFVTGYFSGVLTFDTIPAIVSSGSTNDIFAAKFSSAGNALWAKRSGQNGYESGSGITADANGDAYVTGTFYGSQISLGTTTLPNSGGNEIFIAKYDGAAGNVLWAKGAGGIVDDYCTSICSDASGNIFITGRFNSPVISFGSITLADAGTSNNIFTAKLDNIIGIEENNNSTDGTTMFPNPCSNKLSVNIFSGKGEINIYNTLGEKVLETEITNTKSGIDIRSLPAGIYFVKVFAGEKMAVMKVVKM